MVLAIDTDKTLKAVWSLLETIVDPEIPVLTIVDLGIVRAVECNGEEIIVTITPTYSGCPAMHVFEMDIVTTLQAGGWSMVELKTQYDPPWTTDWMTASGRKKLRDYGIAPPIKGTADKGVLFSNGPRQVQCPRCGSKDSKLISQFGSTSCKALYSCGECAEPYEYFKCI